MTGRKFEESEILAVAKTMKSNGTNSSIIDEFVESLGIQADQSDYVFTFRVPFSEINERRSSIWGEETRTDLQAFENLLQSYDPNDQIDGFTLDVTRSN